MFPKPVPASRRLVFGKAYGKCKTVAQESQAKRVEKTEKTCYTFTMQIILAMVIIFAGGFLQGVVGFGLSPLAIPFLALLFPLHEVVPVMVIISLLPNALVLFSARKKIKFRGFGLLIAAGILFLPVGMLSLKVLNPAYLKLAFGILITAFSVLLLLKKTFPIRREKIGYTFAGSLSGFLNGSLSMSGPPVVLFLSIQGTEKDTVRANLGLYFAILNIVTIPIFLVGGLLTEAVRGYLWYLAPALALGTAAGIVISKKVKEAAFRKITLAVLVATGVWTVIKTISELF
jgi:uncharacterized membrane protein YfcA